MPRKKLGYAFSDEVVKSAKKFGHFKDFKCLDSGWQDGFLPNFRPSFIKDSISSWRVLITACIILISLFGLFLRLFHLQIIEGATFRGLADSNRIHSRIIHAPRGVIYDRNGKVLAESNPGYRLEGRFVGHDEALRLEATGHQGYDKLETDTIRSYPMSEVTSHILGYVSEITESELKSDEFKDYKIGDKLGRAGVEQVYERYLKGTDGAEIIEVDSTGKKLRSLRRIEPIPGHNLHLSIDADLQNQAYNRLKEAVTKVGSCCGSVIAENPKTGEILAMVSLPTFDGNSFTDPTKSQLVSAYFTSQFSPLLNRAIAGTYPPGSTFKIASSLAALGSGRITASTVIEDTGVINLGPYTFANWYFTQHCRKEGMVDIVRALERSNDTFFYKVGELVGEKALADAARKMGMGKKLGIDLPGEVEGLIPSDEWKRQVLDEVWFPGDSLHMAIGQGFLLATPLQVLAQTSYIAANGKLYKPYLVTAISRSDGSFIKRIVPQLLSADLFPKEHLLLVKQGLERVTKQGGTAWPFFNFSIPTAGKTGTAEFGDPRDRTHAWYTSYAPVDDPQLSVTALVEAGGEGSTVASPVVKHIYTWYFNSDKSQIKSLDVAPLDIESRRLGE